MSRFIPKVDFHGKSRKSLKKDCEEIHLAKLLAHAEAATQTRSEKKLWQILMLANLLV